MSSQHDAVIIGAGHNGLVAAGYLAKNGLAVINLERTERVGGPCITKEIIKEFKVSAAAQVLGMLRPQIIQDLELERHGLVYKLREPEAVVPFSDGNLIFTYWDAQRTGLECGQCGAPRSGRSRRAPGQALARPAS